MCHHGTLVVADTVHAAFDEVSMKKKNMENITIFLLLKGVLS